MQAILGLIVSVLFILAYIPQIKTLFSVKNIREFLKYFGYV
ncbi:hypothetical protein CoNPh16_CDS0061 [Staphylococcus phage S-CoN_Ph16]|nr:hypothetical protein CoNPh16_CDS0061 [Staphylococcus phage S-CoN_Ph16]